MPELQAALDAIQVYEGRHRHPGRPKCEHSGLYALYPGQLTTVTMPVAAGWPSTWLFADRAGVYLILDESLRLLYVGKASHDGAIGSRISRA